MGAYNKNYVEDATELQQTIFEQVAKDGVYNFEQFIDRYMKCRYRKMIDKGNPRVINMTWDELMMYLKKDCQEIFVAGKPDIDVLQAGWIGRVYNILQYRSGLDSEELYKSIGYDRIKQLFIPLHTVDEYVAIDKIERELNMN